MTTTTPAEIHDTISKSLVVRAGECRRAASGRRYSGLANAHVRKALRDEARLCDDLVQILEHVSPEALASLLAAKAA